MVGVLGGDRRGDAIPKQMRVHDVTEPGHGGITEGQQPFDNEVPSRGRGACEAATDDVGRSKSGPRRIDLARTFYLIA
jgi:hypothetical protein